MKTLLLIDANSFVHRAFHALPPLSSPDGRPTGALYGLANILLKSLNSIKPDFVAAAFDRPEPTFRKKIFDEYKAHRPKSPDELVSQIIEARNLFKKLNIKIFEKPGFEADDIIGTLAAKYKNKLKIIILSSDLDTLQLVDSDRITVYAPKQGISELTIYDEKAVINKLGVPPSLVTDYKGLVGDQSDNIPGIPGIGPKTALKILNEFHTVENLYENIKESHPLYKKIADYEKDAFLSKKLATIEENVELGESLDELENKNINESEISEYFKSLGFFSLVKKISGAPAESVPPNTPTDPIPNNLEIITEIDTVIKNPSIALTPKNKIAYDWKEIIKKSGTTPKPPYFDIKIAGWLLNPDKKDVSLEALSRRFLREDFDFNNKEASYLKLFLELNKKIKECQLNKIWEKIELPLIPVLADIENAGIKLNPSALENLNATLKKHLKILEREIHSTAGEQFNINSSKQLSEILFSKILTGTKKTKTTKTGQKSTAEDVLKSLLPEHPIIAKILEYREMFKIKSTYVEPLLEASRLGSIRTTFLQTGTATGRLSSKKPNLQNIPAESKWAASLRGAFVTENGYSLVSFDYSQLELRLLAHLSEDKILQKAILDNKDVHALTASKIFQIKETEVTPQMRKIGKTLNFGIIYGMGSLSLSKMINASRKEAERFINAYFTNFPEIKKWQDDVISHAKSFGFIANENGRRRWLPYAASHHARLAAESARAAINMPVQSLNADIIKLSMIKIAGVLKKDGAWQSKVRLLLSIHDELLFEISDDMLPKYIGLIKKIMETAYPLSVPLKVDIQTGKNWGDMKNYKI